MKVTFTGQLRPVAVPIVFCLSPETCAIVAECIEVQDRAMKHGRSLSAGVSWSACFHVAPLSDHQENSGSWKELNPMSLLAQDVPLSIFVRWYLCPSLLAKHTIATAVGSRQVRGSLRLIVGETGSERRSASYTALTCPCIFS